MIKKIWGFIKKGLPFIIGLLIGAGLTKNKAVWFVLIAYFIVMMLTRTISSTAKTISSSDKPNNKAVTVIQFVLDWYVDTVENGFIIGDKIFNNFYATYIFVFNVGLLIASIILWRKGQIQWAWIMFISMNIMIVQNQLKRKLNDKVIIK